MEIVAGGFIFLLLAWVAIRIVFWPLFIGRSRRQRQQIIVVLPPQKRRKK